MDWIRRKAGGYPGPKHAAQGPAGEELERERIRSGPAGVVFPWFAPYAFEVTGETAAMRAAYRRMFADPNVKAALLGTVYGVASLDLQVHPATKHNAHDQAVADYAEWQLTRRIKDGVAGLIETILLPGQIDGYSLSAKVWGRQERGKYAGNYVLRQLKSIDTGNDAVLQTDDRRNVVGVMGLRFNAGQELSPAEFVIYRHLPLYNAPTGTSALRAVYKRWWFLETILTLRGIAAEKRALPFLWGNYSNSAEKLSLEEMLGKAKSQNWASLPQNVKIAALAIAGEADAIFKSFCDDLREEIFLGIQGATLQALTGGQGEQRGSSKVHKNTADLFRWRLSAAIESLLNDEEQGLIKDCVDLNYVVDEYPRATLSAVDPQELAAEITIDTGLSGMGLALSKEETYERYGRTPPKDDEDALKKEEPGQGGPGAPGTGGPGMPGPGGGGDPLAALLGGGGGDDEGGEEEGGTEQFAERVRRFRDFERFCMEGENAHKPGPCPGPQQDAAGQAAARGAPATKEGRAVRPVREFTDGAGLGKELAGLSAAPGLDAAQKEDRARAARMVADRMPPEAVEHLAKTLKAIEACADDDAVARSFSEVTGDPINEDEIIEGCWVAGEGRLTMDGGTKYALADNPQGFRTLSREEQTQSAREILAHELGHALDTANGKTEAYSGTDYFRKAFRKEIKDGQLSDYAATHPVEGFAEFARLVHGTDTPQEEIEEKFPLCTAYFSALGYLPWEY